MQGPGMRILSIDDLSNGDVNRLFFAARNMQSDFRAYQQKFAHAMLMTAFFEVSTRTRLSFEMAAHRLGMKFSSFLPSASSLQKGESEEETIRTLLSMEPEVLVIRQSTPLDASLFSSTRTAIINGGDGANEHPTQALLDCFTLVNHFKCDDLHGKKILIAGDIAHSRVARSNIKLMSRLGAEVVLLAPPSFSMKEALGQKYAVSSFKELNTEFDAIMCLRVQKERIALHEQWNEAEFREHFTLSMSRFLGMGSRCVVMHPGPMNVGVEIDLDVARHSRSLIDQQVTHGVFVRAALIEHCLL